MRASISRKVAWPRLSMNVRAVLLVSPAELGLSMPWNMRCRVAAITGSMSESLGWETSRLSCWGRGVLASVLNEELPELCEPRRPERGG
jgi:hypothetical protein